LAPSDPPTRLHGRVWFITVHIARLCSGRHGLKGELPQELEIVKHLARPQHNAGQWVIGNRDRKSRFFADASMQVFQQRATAGEHDAAVADVSRKPLKETVGTRRLELLTSTVSILRSQP